MLQNKGKSIALTLSLVAAALTGSYVNAVAEQPRAVQETATQEKSEKQRAFEDYLAKKNAEFDRKFNEVKARNDELRRKFDSLPESSTEEVIAANARSLRTHVCK